MNIRIFSTSKILIYTRPLVKLVLANLPTSPLKFRTSDTRRFAANIKEKSSPANGEIRKILISRVPVRPGKWLPDDQSVNKLYRKHRARLPSSNFIGDTGKRQSPSEFRCVFHLDRANEDEREFGTKDAGRSHGRTFDRDAREGRTHEGRPGMPEKA